MSKAHESGCRLLLIDEAQSMLERRELSTLLVEGGDDFVTGASKLMDEAGYTVHHASTCAEALEAVQARPVQMVVLDMRKKSEPDARKLFRYLSRTWTNMQALMVTRLGHATKAFHMTGHGVFECNGRSCNLDEALQIIRNQCQAEGQAIA